MATMLRSAAMTLLSKTLLTFLYKYLSDVDVEGIEMPSLYGSTEGPGSGWGVRLSNVKLREGAELMILPGSKKPKKTKANNPNTTDGNSTVSSKGSSKKKKKRRKKEEESPHGETTTAEALKEDKTIPQNLNLNGNERTINGQPNGVARLNIQASSVMTSSTGDELESESGSLASLQEIENERPETPTQNSSISFLSCFAPGSSAKGDKRTKPNVDRIPEHTEAERKPSSDANSGKEDEIQQVVGGKTVIINGDAELGTQALCEAIQESIDEKIPGVTDLLEEDEDDESEAEEENEAVEDDDDNVVETQPMALRIGENGSIGILDIRYVGRELHVLVEDAFLTLEAVRKEPELEEPGAGKGSTDGENSTTDLPTPAESTEKTAAAPAPAPNAPIDINDLKTTGERVLATNAIARIFSSIPHLSLRDVVVRIIVRGDTQTETPSNVKRNEEGANDDDAEVIVDIGIGLLSVTDGDDFVSPFNDTDDENSNGEEEAPTPPQSLNTTSHGVPSQDNEYLEKRIRTGKGEDGGLWLNIVTPKYYNPSLDRVFSTEKAQPSIDHLWARQVWLESTHNCFLRLSGLDIQARTFLGTRQELSQASGSYLFSNDDMSTYNGIDHTLYGFDHVVPGPTPSTLPPLAPGPLCSASRSMEEGEDNTRSQIYKTDQNGIQSCKISSNFYRVARGMTPTRCTLEHLPCENCFKCWEASGPRTGETVDEAHILDAFTPLPGLTLSVSMRDPLELNVDRLSLNGLGLLMSLFKKPEEPAEAATAIDNVEAPEFEAMPEAVTTEEPSSPPEIVDEPEPSRGYFSSFFFGSSKPEESESKGRRLSGLLSKRKPKPKPPAFPPYMKPENIELIGVFIGEVRLRIHIMRADDDARHNNGLSFCYWDVKVQCLTLDQQKLISEGKWFTDMRLDLGLLMINEFKGVDKKVVISAGVPHPDGEDDFVSLASLSSCKRGGRPPWPATSSVLLDVPAPLESLVYENRERHGVQFRMLKVIDQPESSSERIRTVYNCQFGALEIDMPFRVGGFISEVKGEAMKSLRIAQAEEEPPVEPPRDSATQYRVQLGGGRIRMNPSIDVRLPLTRMAGSICSESGFSMETLLDKVELSYGESSKKLVPTANSVNGVSLRRFPGLPEHVRLRILLFLDDLEPLEKALHLKAQANSFLRCNAVNKGLSKIAAKRTKKKAAEESRSKLNRRQQLMNKLLTLDDDTLESLWASHQRKHRKVKKRNSVGKTG